MLTCLNCGKPSEKRICDSCEKTMPEHLKQFNKKSIFDLIDKVAEEKRQGK